MADVWRAVIPENVLYSDLTAESIRVYACLDRHCDKEGICWPGLTRISKLIHLSRPTVIQSIKALEESKFIVVQREQRKKSIYLLPLHKLVNGVNQFKDDSGKPSEPVKAQTGKAHDNLSNQTGKPALPEVTKSLSKSKTEVKPSEPFDKERFFKNQAVRRKALEEAAFDKLGFDPIKGLTPLKLGGMSKTDDKKRFMRGMSKEELKRLDG